MDVPREKLVGADFSNYFTEPGKSREGYQLVFSKGAVTDYPLTIRHRDGKLTDVLYNASVYKDVAGNVLGVFAAARDITAQRKAEAQVAEQRSRELERQVSVVRLTSNDQPEYREIARRYGASHFLTQAVVTKEEIQNVVKSFLSEKR